MARVRQGMIQRLEHYTDRLKPKDEKAVLRLRKGKIKKGAYKGSISGRLKYFFSGRILTKAGRSARHKHLKDVTEVESKALAKTLCKDISRRTPVIYKAEQIISAKDVKVLLEASADERAKFDDIVDEFATITTTESTLHTPHEGGKLRLDQYIMNRDIAHHGQMQFLKKEVTAKLRQKSSRRKSRRPLDKEGQPEKRLTTFKKSRRLAERAIEEKMPIMALLHEAEQYAFKENVQNMNGVSGPDRQARLNGVMTSVELEQKPIEKGDQEKILQSLKEHTPGATRKLVAELAVEHMIELGVTVDPGDFPQRETTTQEEVFQKRLISLRGSRNRWDHLVADLLEDEDYEKAILLEDITQDARPLLALEALRDKVSDKAYAKDQKARVKGLEKRKVVKRKTPRTDKKRPQDTIDRVLPWRGGHTHVESRLAKAGVTFPLSMDGNNQGKEEVIEQTVNMLKAKYPELGSVHARGDLQVVRDYLSRHVKDRTIVRTTPLTYIKQPLKDLEKPLVEIEGDDVEDPTKPKADSAPSGPSFESTVSSRSSRSHSMAEHSSIEDAPPKKRAYSQDSGIFDTQAPALDLRDLEDPTKPKADSTPSGPSFESTVSSRSSRSHSMAEHSSREDAPPKKRAYSQDSGIFDTQAPALDLRDLEDPTKPKADSTPSGPSFESTVSSRSSRSHSMAESSYRKDAPPKKRAYSQDSGIFDTQAPALDLRGLKDPTKPKADSTPSGPSFESTVSSRPSRSHSMAESSYRKDAPPKKRAYSQDSGIFDTQAPALDLRGLKDPTKPKADSTPSGPSFESTVSSRPSRSHSMAEPSSRKDVPLRKRAYSQDSGIDDTEEVNLTGTKQALEEDEDDLFSTSVTKQSPPPENNPPPEEINT